MEKAVDKVLAMSKTQKDELWRQDIIKTPGIREKHLMDLNFQTLQIQIRFDMWINKENFSKFAMSKGTFYSWKEA